MSGVFTHVFGGRLGPGARINALHLRTAAGWPPGGGGRTDEAGITVEATSRPQTDEDLARAPLKPLLQLHGIVTRLEWPVVVIPDLARAMPSSSEAVAFDPELGVSVDFSEENGQPALHRLIRDKKARLEVDETRRVFYVAPTRARDHYILTCTGLTERLCGLAVLQPGPVATTKRLVAERGIEALVKASLPWASPNHSAA